MARFAAALSEHPLASHAAGEVVGELLEQVGPRPDVAVLFVSGDHVSEIDDIAQTVRLLLQPGALVGTSAAMAAAGRREVEEAPAVSLWAASHLDATAIRLRTVRTDQGVGVVGWPDPPPEHLGAVMLLADPYSFPVDGLLDHLSEHHPGVPVVGGLASAGSEPGQNRLVIDNAVVDDGAVGLLLGPGTTAVVSQGCRPVGEAWTVTDATDNVLRGLGGATPMERLREVVANLPADERDRISGFHIGLVVDEHQPDFDQGDFLIRGLLDADTDEGTLTIGAEVPVGATVQFQVRDADAADQDLRTSLSGHQAEAALMFTCNGRGTHLFGDSDHDASLVDELLGSIPVAGMSCAGEIGPVGSRSHLHGFTTSLLLFCGA